MEENETVFDYSTPVHRVLLQPNMILGIGAIPALIILIITVILMNIVSYWCAGIGIALYIIAKLLCKKDPYMLTILFDRLMQPDVWRK